MEIEMETEMEIKMKIEKNKIRIEMTAMREMIKKMIKKRRQNAKINYFKSILFFLRCTRRTYGQEVQSVSDPVHFKFQLVDLIKITFKNSYMDR